MFTSMTKRYIVRGLLFIGLLVFLAGGFFVYQKKELVIQTITRGKDGLAQKIENVKSFGVNTYRDAVKSRTVAKFDRRYSDSDSYKDVHRPQIVAALDGIAKTPNDAQLWVDLGSQQYGLQDYAGAEESFLKAYQYAPKATVVLWNLVKLYEVTRDFAKAERYALESVRAFPKLSDGYILEADVYQNYLTEKSYLLPKIYADAFTQTGSDEFLRLSAQYWQGQGNKENAIKYYNEWLRRTPPGVLHDDISNQIRELEGTTK